MNKFLVAIVVLNTMMFGFVAFMQKIPKIVTLDTQHIIKRLASDVAKQELEKDELEKILKEKISHMDDVVLKLAKDKGYVVLSKAAVVSPCMDITEIVIREVLDEKSNTH